jgi:invasion protein IalB
MERRDLMRTVWIAWAVVIAASGAVAAPAPQNNTSVASDGGSGWRVECANDGKQLDCRTINRVHQRDTQQLIAAVAVRIAPETKKPALVIQLPLGIQVTEPVTMRVDDGQTERLSVATCTQTGCVGGAAISDAMLGAMRSGKELKVAFQSAARQIVTVTMPLAGFGIAWEKIK